jgi:serine protease inhibitor
VTRIAPIGLSQLTHTRRSPASWIARMPSFRPVSRYIVLTSLLLAASCGEVPSEPDKAPGRLDALPRPLTTGESRIVDAANQFSFSLFQRVNSSPDSNVFASPLSASFALGMTMNGAANATLEQMRSALAFGSATDAEINAGYKGLIELLRGLDPQVDMRIANGIWSRAGFPVEPSFLETSRTFFGAETASLDFSDPASLTAINGWVSKATADKIPTILDELSDDLVVLLVNAIYFKGSWREQFDPALTQDAPFHAVVGDQPARLMHRKGTMQYLGTPDFQAVDLPYGNSAYSMTVVLPREGKSVETVAASIQPAQWTALTSQLRDAEVDLHLPRFTLKWERMLNDDLKALGMVDAFIAGGADFTRLSPQGRALFISFVKQKAFVDVNEEGTEAAAVTAVGISVTSAPPSPTVRVDRPFLFVIRERLSGTILFMGKVVRLE